MDVLDELRGLLHGAACHCLVDRFRDAGSNLLRFTRLFRNRSRRIRSNLRFPLFAFAGGLHLFGWDRCFRDGSRGSGCGNAVDRFAVGAGRCYQQHQRRSEEAGRKSQ